MNREEHLAWCKKRAIEYVNAGDLPQAYASMASDMRKHPELENHAAIQLGMMLMMGGNLSTSEEMRKFIEVRLSGSSVTAWCDGEKLAITVIAQKRQEEK